MSNILPWSDPIRILPAGVFLATVLFTHVKREYIRITRKLSLGPQQADKVIIDMVERLILDELDQVFDSRSMEEVLFTIVIDVPLNYDDTSQVLLGDLLVSPETARILMAIVDGWRLVLLEREAY